MEIDWAMGRLRELRGEYAEGEAQLLGLDRQRAQIQDALLRVAGAIQVLDELIAASGAFDGNGTNSAPSALNREPDRVAASP
jgi:hypothetical protein